MPTHYTLYHRGHTTDGITLLYQYMNALLVGVFDSFSWMKSGKMESVWWSKFKLALCTRISGCLFFGIYERVVSYGFPPLIRIHYSTSYDVYKLLYIVCCILTGNRHRITNVLLQRLVEVHTKWSAWYCKHNPWTPYFKKRYWYT